MIYSLFKAVFCSQNRFSVDIQKFRSSKQKILCDSEKKTVLPRFSFVEISNRWETKRYAMFIREFWKLGRNGEKERGNTYEGFLQKVGEKHYGNNGLRYLRTKRTKHRGNGVVNKSVPARFWSINVKSLFSTVFKQFECNF